MEKTVTKVILRESETDAMGYITYVFEVLELDEIKRLGTKYLTTVRYPNWDHAKVKIGDIGFVSMISVIGGIDQYYNGKTMNYYKYSNDQFLKFIPMKSKIDKHIKID